MRRCALPLWFVLLFALLMGCDCTHNSESSDAVRWTAQDRRVIASLSLRELPPRPPAPSNAYADNPGAAGLGSLLFSDPRLSDNGQVSCASCHQPARQFTDGLAQSRGIGQVARNAPSLAFAAWSTWQFWDGRADSLWSQALAPLTHPLEQGLDAARIADHIIRYYRPTYENVFGELPLTPSADEAQRITINAAKSIAAFERGLRPTPTRFDHFADAIAKNKTSDSLSATEQQGLQLFIGRGRCLRCHSGALLTDQGFHNTGLSNVGATLSPNSTAEAGRSAGLRLALASPFNCHGKFSDSHHCPHLDFARAGNAEWLGAFKTPSLRELVHTAPYMHDGRFTTLAQVVEHYDRARNLDGVFGHSELLPLGLTAEERHALVAFLKSLSTP